MDKIFIIVVVIAIVVGAVMAVKPGPANTDPAPQLTQFVDSSKTSKLVLDYLTSVDDDLNSATIEPAEAAIITVTASEVLFGIQECIRGNTGSAIYRSVSSYGTSDYIFMWDYMENGVPTKAFVFINNSNVYHLNEGLVTPIIRAGKFVNFLEQNGWDPISAKDLPAWLTHAAMQTLVANIARATLEIVSFPNSSSPTFLLIFPELFIYFRAIPEPTNS